MVCRFGQLAWATGCFRRQGAGGGRRGGRRRRTQGNYGWKTRCFHPIINRERRWLHALFLLRQTGICAAKADGSGLLLRRASAALPRVEQAGARAADVGFDALAEAEARRGPAAGAGGGTAGPSQRGDGPCGGVADASPGGAEGSGPGPEQGFGFLFYRPRRRKFPDGDRPAGNQPASVAQRGPAYGHLADGGGRRGNRSRGFPRSGDRVGWRRKDSLAERTLLERGMGAAGSRIKAAGSQGGPGGSERIAGGTSIGPRGCRQPRSDSDAGAQPEGHPWLGARNEVARAGGRCGRRIFAAGRSNGPGRAAPTAGDDGGFKPKAAKRFAGAGRTHPAKPGAWVGSSGKPQDARARGGAGGSQVPRPANHRCRRLGNARLDVGACDGDTGPVADPCPDSCGCRGAAKRDGWGRRARSDPGRGGGGADAAADPDGRSGKGRAGCAGGA